MKSESQGFGLGKRERGQGEEVRESGMELE
jgi:hypothetical protein